MAPPIPLLTRLEDRLSETFVALRRGNAPAAPEVQGLTEALRLAAEANRSRLVARWIEDHGISDAQLDMTVREILGPNQIRQITDFRRDMTPSPEAA